MPDVGDSVMEFVAQFTGIKRERLTPTLTLFGDLGVDGADGWELIESFGRQFRVDISDFRAHRHFGPEERAGLTPIRISDLIASVQERKWTL